VATLGFASTVDDGRVSVLYSYPYGVGQYVLAPTAVPAVLQPTGEGVREIDAGPLKANPNGAIEWLLLFGGVQRVVSSRLADLETAACFWAGFSNADPLTADQLAMLEAIARKGADALRLPISADAATEQLRRLERTGELLPALLHTLDVRDVFDHVSATAKIALPHDLLLLRLFNEDLTKITIYARSDRGTDGGQVVPHLYPASVVRAWEFDIVDDLTAHPVEATNAPTKLGARSALRLPIRFNDRVIGGMGFLSYERQSTRRPTSPWPVARRRGDWYRACRRPR
jgi:hypothetical protein